MTCVAFGGHFAVGEKTTETEKKTLELAKARNCDLAVVVNDIDIGRKIFFYRELGKEAMLRHYGNRRKCGTTRPLCSLPDYASLLERIDWDFYQHALRKLPSKIEGLNHPNFKEGVRDLIDEHIRERVAPEIKIYKESDLRNYAAHRRARKKGMKFSWDEIGELQDIFTGRKAPTCGAILLALFEMVRNQGYDKIIQYYSSDECKSIEKATQLYKSLSSRIDAWNLEFETHFLGLSDD